MKIKANDILVVKNDRDVLMYPDIIKIISIKDSKCTFKHFYRNEFRWEYISDFTSNIVKNYKRPTDRELKLIQLKMIK